MRSFWDFFVDINTRGGFHHLIERLTESGLVTFDIPSVDALLDLASALGEIVPHRDSDPRGITRIAAKSLSGAAGYGGFSHRGLPLHTDRSGTPEPPTVLLMLGSTPAEIGGESTLLDGAKLFTTLAEQLPEVLRLLMTPDCMLFGGAGSLLSASVFTQLSNDRIAVRFRFDELGYFRAELVPHIPVLVKLMNELAACFHLERGQGYALQNWRWLHGRTAFSGEREAYRVLVEVPPGSPIQRGFEISATTMFAALSFDDPGCK